MRLEILENFSEIRNGTVYIVTGWQRSFTSAMMKALIAGGMDAVYDESRNTWAEAQSSDPSYNPNPDGLFEMDDAKRNHFFRMPAAFKGKLVKILDNHGRFSPEMWTGDYKVVVMLREPAEIRESYTRFFGHPPTFTDGAQELSLTDELYFQLMVRTLRACRNRRDIDYLVVQGSDLIAEPLAVFQRMRLAGWPIDAERAASQINQKLYRCHTQEPATAALHAQTISN